MSTRICIRKAIIIGNTSKARKRYLSFQGECKQHFTIANRDEFGGVELPGCPTVFLRILICTKSSNQQSRIKFENDVEHQVWNASSFLSFAILSFTFSKAWSLALSWVADLPKMHCSMRCSVSIAACDSMQQFGEKESK